MSALRERAKEHGRSVQQEVRQILATAASARPPAKTLEPVRLVTVRTDGTSSWRREEIYGDQGR